MLTRNEYVASMKKKLDEWSAEMDVLEGWAHATNLVARVKCQEQLSALHARRREGERRLEAINAATEDSWHHLKEETENAWAAFKDSVYAFKAHVQ